MQCFALHAMHCYAVHYMSLVACGLLQFATACTFFLVKTLNKPKTVKLLVIGCNPLIAVYAIAMQCTASKAC